MCDSVSAFVFVACEKAASSSLWLYVFLGNMLRGVGETPVMPLGLSYLDDFSRAENTALYMGMNDYQFQSLYYQFWHTFKPYSHTAGYTSNPLYVKTYQFHYTTFI